MIYLTYTISSDRKTLTVLADGAARLALKEMKEEDFDSFYSDKAMYEAFEQMICNSELSWIDPSDSGDLTDAPILGILGEEGIKDITVFLENHGLVETGSDGRNTFVRPILERWGFMQYQITSPLDDLLTHGRAVFVAP